MNFSVKRIWLIATCLLLLGTKNSWGNPWEDASTQDLLGYARAVSLDVRGVVPNPEELESIEASGELPEEMLNSWLDSEEFEGQVIEQHRELFWNSLSMNLLNRRRITKRGGIYMNPQRSRYHRIVRNTNCGDFEADVNELNQPQSWITNEDGSISEGWVWVTPYWDLDTQVKVCAFDAQLTELSADEKSCSNADGHSKSDCGCGPNLNWCITSSVENDIEEALVRDIDERVRHMVQSNGSYIDLLFGQNMYINGASAHFFRYIAVFNESSYESPIPIVDLPELEFTDQTWTEISLSEEHSGVLTAPGWLLRHQTNRGRANRFYGAFLCKEFIPPETGISGLSGNTNPTPNLILREGCAGCHARLEPWAAYWSRWGEASMTYQSTAEYPAYLEECAQCDATNSCSSLCKNYYLTEQTHQDEGPYLGWLNTYAFLTEDKRENPDIGPIGWVNQTANDGSFTSCSIQNASNWLINWEEADEELIEQWATYFSSGLSYKEMVKMLVRSPQYWRGE